jgi:hypothetical protein
MERQGFTIDLARLPGSQGKVDDYRLEMKLVAKDGTATADTYTIGAGTSREGVRDLVMRSIEGAGWRVKAIGKEGFLVEGYGTKQFSPIKTAVLKSPDLLERQQPKVERVPEQPPAQPNPEPSRK